MKENIFSKTWKFLRKDSWLSLIVTLVIAFLIIKLVVFPLLSFFTGTSLPLVIVESCSMHHSVSMQEIMSNPVYAQYGLSYDDSKSWSFQNGFNKGDIVFVVGAKNIKVGDVIIFNGGTNYPIIHRIVNIDENGRITTKGDNNSDSLPQEKSFSKELVLGKAVFRIPYLGWIKLIFFEFLRNDGSRGFC